MCGIFSIISGETISKEFTGENNNIVDYNFNKGKSRGPENSTLKFINNNVLFGFHRLAINGLNELSNQPICINGVYLICNGEIYNYQSIYKELQITPKTNSDCESIIHLYQKYGIQYTLQNLDGVFSFVLYDSNKSLFYIARDPYGVRPLFYIYSNNTFICASLLKQINSYSKNQHVLAFPTGSVCSFKTTNNNIVNVHFEKYIHFPLCVKSFHDSSLGSFLNNYKELKKMFENTRTLTNANNSKLYPFFETIYKHLYESVKKRVLTTERNMACLLSGGLDSSLICALVSKFLPKKQLKTFSIGMSNGSDLKYAKLVAEHIQSDHTEIILSEFEFFQAINQVIYNIESYDTTTVRASVGNYLVSKYISENTDCKVIFNGDGSDELTGGYLYFHNCPDNIEFDFECKRLLKDIQFFDVLRSDRSISCHGLEARTPFLDRTFVQSYLSLPIELRNHNNYNGMEKQLLRSAVKTFDPNLLPNEVLWRTKEAFSDGVSSKEKSWFEIIQDQIDKKYTDKDFESLSKKYTFNKPTTKEQLYYREIFDSYFSNQDKTIPYFWMPKYSNATDSSARTLEIYNNMKQKNNLEGMNENSESDKFNNLVEEIMEDITLE